MKRVPVLLAFLLALSSGAMAQEWIRDSLYSPILKETRLIEIALPKAYRQDTARYDVWYVLDGEWNAYTFSMIHNYLRAISFMPPIIIVSVPNRYLDGYNLRDRDLTPKPTPEIAYSGGAQNFLGFLNRELLPHINRQYRTSGYNGLCGSSFGGMFALYALLKTPDTFKYYVIADAALHYANGYFPGFAAQVLPGTKFRNRVLHMGGRSGYSYHYMRRDAMDSTLRSLRPEGLRWHSELYEDETHSSTTFKGNYDGLKYAYLGYYTRKVSFHLTGGIVVPGKPIKLLLETDHSDIRYTTDGSIPNAQSTRVDGALIVDKTDGLRVKSFSTSGLYDREIPVHVTTGDFLRPKEPNRKQDASGKITAAEWTADGKIAGVLPITADGYYVFQLTPSPGTRLWLDDRLWISYNTATGHARQTVMLPLRKGNYYLRVEHSKTRDTPSLDFGVYYSIDGQDDWWKNVIVRK